MSNEWTVWVMFGDGRSVVETAAGELEAFSRRGELEADGLVQGSACLPPGSADLAPLLERRIGSALCAWQAECQAQAERMIADYFGDSGVA